MALLRTAKLAGQWYEKDPRRLAAQIDEWTGRADASSGAPPVFLLVPHAGHMWSGAVAGRGFGALKGADLRRIVLLAPSHYVAFPGIALPPNEMELLETPIGDLEVDPSWCRQLEAATDLFVRRRDAVDMEHALEVELPFLARLFPRVPVVPLVCGQMDRTSAKQAGLALGDLMEDGTVLVVSSDLTHYGADYGFEPFGPGGPSVWRKVEAMDRGGLARILEGDAEGLFDYIGKTGWTACGALPASVALWALDVDVEGEVLDYTSSSAISGDDLRSVSYGAVLLRSEQPLVPKALRTALRHLAADAIREAVGLSASLSPRPDHPGLGLRRGAFVTLTKAGELRGCIGHPSSDLPLGDVIRKVARDAAVADPRFPPVTAEELPDIAVEISVLSPPRKVASLSEVRVPHHGLLIRGQRGAGLLLPQVAEEYGLDRDAFFAMTLRKAGLAPDTPPDAVEIYVFAATVF